METDSRKNGRSVQRGRKKASTGARRDIDALLEKLREFKIEHFKDGDFEIKVSPLAFIPAIKESKTTEHDDELLYYSSQGAPKQAV